MVRVPASADLEGVVDTEADSAMRGGQPAQETAVVLPSTFEPIGAIFAW
jgi:hypothetical protein